MWYVFDEHRNLADKDNLPYIKGNTYIFDGIEVYCLLGTGEVGGPLFVDKNHDLSYYFTNSDYVDEDENYVDEFGRSSWIINNANKYGYEWGGYNTETRVQDTAIGTGLNNTNQLISKNLQPNTDGWYVVWDKIKEFRADHSDQWFLPSIDELNLIYENRTKLSNLSLNTLDCYWSSSEYSSIKSCYLIFGSGSQHASSKNTPRIRSRLCYTI